MLRGLPLPAPKRGRGRRWNRRSRRPLWPLGNTRYETGADTLDETSQDQLHEETPEEFEQSLEGGSHDLPILALLTALWERSGDLERARDAAQKWVAACPLDGHGHYRLGLLEQQLGHYAAAVERFELAATLTSPDDTLYEAALDALDVLDSIQVRQALALWEVDTGFRAGLDSDPRLALRQRGFAISDAALQTVLNGVHTMPARFRGRSPRPC